MPIQEVVKRHPLTSTKVHHRAKNKQFSTLRCTKTGSTQPKLSAACFVVQSCLADADFVVFSNYCLIGTRQMAVPFVFAAPCRGGRPCPPDLRPHHVTAQSPSLICPPQITPNCDPAQRSQFGKEEGASGYGAFAASAEAECSWLLLTPRRTRS